jgi:Dolichyl-phosphate-mannose-protein mannosyltransferase
MRQTTVDGPTGLAAQATAAPGFGLPSIMHRGAEKAAIDVPVLAPNDLWQRRLDMLVWAFVALGVVLRVGRYLLNFPFWGDELMLIQNYLDRDYADLVKPLSLEQVAPLGFLAIELTAIKLFGFSEWSLRLFCCASSVAGLFLFRDVAGRLLGKAPMALAVGIFAVSYYPVRHAAECKPYGSDLVASLVLVWLAVRWWQDQANRRWLWGLAMAGPLCITVSNPTVFVAGGVTMALAWPVWQSRDRRAWLAFVAYNVLVAGVFLVLMRLVTSGQYVTTQKFMLDYWSGGFPPAAPLTLVSWLASIHAGEMMAYPVGDDRFGSTLTLICFLAGVVMLGRRKDRTAMVLVLAPLGLAMAAAALRRYPYGGARLSQYYASLACLSAGLGAASLMSLFARVEVRRRVFGGVIAVLFVIGVAMLARDMSHPYKRLVDFEHRGFARWFWKENAAEGEVICLHTDLDKNFYTPRAPEDYLCYQRAYSAAHRQGARGVKLADLPTDRPLHCVMFALEGQQRDEAAFAGWLSDMTARYELTNQQSYRVKLNGPREPDRFGRYTVFEFRSQPEIETASRAAPPPK